MEFEYNLARERVEYVEVYTVTTNVPNKKRTPKRIDGIDEVFDK